MHNTRMIIICCSVGMNLFYFLIIYHYSLLLSYSSHLVSLLFLHPTFLHFFNFFHYWSRKSGKCKIVVTISGISWQPCFLNTNHLITTITLKITVLHFNTSSGAHDGKKRVGVCNAHALKSFLSNRYRNTTSSSSPWNLYGIQEPETKPSY